MTDWGRRAGELSDAAIADGRPTEWFEQLYAEAAAGKIGMPWPRTEPHPVLLEWADRPGNGPAGRAVVVGTGLGADAAFLASRGWETTGFDLSESAIAEARRRFPGVDLRIADLTDLPDDLVGAFDLVVEIFTIQAVEAGIRPELMAGVRRLLAPGGRLVAVQFRAVEGQPLEQGPPFPQTREAMERLGQGLRLEALEAIPGSLWLGEYTQPTR